MGFKRAGMVGGGWLRACLGLQVGVFEVVLRLRWRGGLRCWTSLAGCYWDRGREVRVEVTRDVFMRTYRIDSIVDAHNILHLVVGWQQ
jgi:hypothetical protein